MSTGIIGRNADIYVNEVLAGAAKGVTVGITADLIKDYVIGDDKPNVLASGNKSFPVSMDTLYIDKTYATLVLNGTPITVEIHPAGSGESDGKYTLSNVVLTSWEKTIAQEGLILESVSGEGKSITLPT